MKPYQYLNRKGVAHYFRAAETKRGKLRYYVTKSAEYPDLIKEIPRGYEVIEQPEEARVVIRKIKPLLVSQEEKEILHDAIEEFSAFKDFFIYAEEKTLYVFHSQFNYSAGIDANLSREEAKEIYGPTIERWMRFMSSMRFILVDDERRLFQTERVVNTSYYGHGFYPVGEPGAIEDVAREFGQHLGRESYFDIRPYREED